MHRLFHPILFSLLTLMFALFAFTSLGAGQPLVAVAAAVLCAWSADLAWSAARRMRRTQSPRSSD